MPAGPRGIAAVLLKQWSMGLLEARLGLTSASRRRAAMAARTRRAFEDLGPSFIKIGQLMSVRPDVFSTELVFELEKLQDSVPPADYGLVRAIVAAEFGRPPEELFAAFDPKPIASASIAQVHRAVLDRDFRPAWGATLPAGADVVVKIIRPGVEESILADLAKARRWSRRLAALGLPRRVDLDGLLNQIGESLHRELDMRLEGRTADRFAFNFRDDPVVLIPRVAWGRTSRRVLTMEYVEGWPLSELGEARAAGVDTRALAVHGAAAFMKQVLIHGLFHADLHHANLFATPGGRIAYLDFGIHGVLSPEERENVAQVLAALVYRDADRALKYSAGLGVRIRPEKVGAMRRELGALMDRTLRAGGGAGEADVRHFGMGFMSLLYRYGIDIPVGYSLLVKSLVTIEGVSRGLYPDINIIELAKPFVTKVLSRSLMRPDRLRERLGPALRAVTEHIVS